MNKLQKPACKILGVRINSQNLTSHLKKENRIYSQKVLALYYRAAYTLVTEADHRKRQTK